ncbi:cilia- and flagella-associated protein 58 [Melopsittacus undulatus]|uniref:cilia- and flagella-associated protein 58 n=1 Tax=Melopsittacus undulatus TaxID=13146 RepID=UPI00146C35E5|nr:cilia- and flagella-associated protein 58 [Melopsittacus undulatus]
MGSSSSEVLRPILPQLTVPREQYPSARTRRKAGSAVPAPAGEGVCLWDSPVPLPQHPPRRVTGFYKPYLDESAFEALEKDFQDVINQLKGDKALEKFRKKYGKLHTLLKKSHENEKYLVEECRNLNAELVVNSSKVAALLKLSRDDQSTISSMKTEIDKAWKMVDTAYEKEQRAKKRIASLQDEIARLSSLVEQGSKGQDHNICDLLKYKEDITNERDQLLSEVVELRQSLTQATEQQQATEKAKTEADQSIKQLQEDIEVQRNEVTREARKKERLEKELKNLQAELDDKQTEIKNLQQDIERNKEEQLKMEENLKEQKLLNEKAGKELEQLHMRNNKLMQENEQHNVMFEEMMKSMQEKTAELKARDEEVAQMRLEISKLNKTREILQNKLHASEEQKIEATHERNILKNRVSGLEKELETAKKQADTDKKAVEELVKERDKLRKNMVKATSTTEKQINLVKLHEQSKKKLENEIQNYKIEAQKQSKIIYQLEKERDSFISETNELKHKVLQNLKDIERREKQICDYEKKLEETTIKLKQEQSQFETVRTERNLFSKKLVEAKDELSEMKKKFKSVTHQLDQLKQDIKSKEDELVKAHLENQQTEKEKELLKAELLQMKKQALETKHFIENQEAEEKRLLKIIAEADAERLKQKREIDQVINKRDILGSQLVQRNDEVALLYEKIKIQQSILNKGENQYRQRMEDIQLLKVEIKKLRREKGILDKRVANVEDLRQEINHMRKELLREQTRCKVLEEELENPLNVHRWRKLEATDPSTYELIEKIQRLQKQLITKTGEVIEKELLLQKEEKLYVELKRILARQPGPEVAEQLQLCRRTLREKTKQLKVLSSELNMYESQNKEYKHEIERLGNELTNVKKKYLAQKRKEQQAKEKERLVTAKEPKCPRNKSDVPRFIGAGFALSTPLPKISV